MPWMPNWLCRYRHAAQRFPVERDRFGVVWFCGKCGVRRFR